MRKVPYALPVLRAIVACTVSGEFFRCISPYMVGSWVCCRFVYSGSLAVPVTDENTVMVSKLCNL